MWRGRGVTRHAPSCRLCLSECQSRPWEQAPSPEKALHQTDESRGTQKGGVHCSQPSERRDAVGTKEAPPRPRAAFQRRLPGAAWAASGQTRSDGRERAREPRARPRRLVARPVAPPQAPQQRGALLRQLLLGGLAVVLRRLLRLVQGFQGAGQPGGWLVLEFRVVGFRIEFFQIQGVYVANPSPLRLESQDLGGACACVRACVCVCVCVCVYVCVPETRGWERDRCGGVVRVHRERGASQRRGVCGPVERGPWT
jgi:hypothetical protein